jgi:hypothetical protein
MALMGEDDHGISAIHHVSAVGFHVTFQDDSVPHFHRCTTRSGRVLLVPALSAHTGLRIKPTIPTQTPTCASNSLQQFYLGINTGTPTITMLES